VNRRLVVLWDPENPIVPARSLVAALGRRVDVAELTFGQVSHRTLPNGAFDLAPEGRQDIDGVLWIEGGPLPRDLERFDCPKAAWLVNDHAEPTLVDDLAGRFDPLLVSSLRHADCAKKRWLPLCADEGNPLTVSSGVSVNADDPVSPEHAVTMADVVRALESVPPPRTRVAVCLGQAGRPHPLLFECLRAGIAVVADPESDLRGIAHVGEHLEVFPANGEFAEVFGNLVRDEERLSRLAIRGPEIVSHLHTAEIRAAELCDAIWPGLEVLSGERFHPKVSVLVTCHRFRRRLRHCLQSLARQDLAPGTLEIVVADPKSPDGLAQYLREFATSAPHVRVVRLPLDARYHRNRGYCIDRAFDSSLGEVVVGIDGDIIFPPHLVRVLAEAVAGNPEKVFGVRRVFLDRPTTEGILTGCQDRASEFDRLSRSEGDGQEGSFVGVLGYCQALHRAAFAKARYPREFDAVNQSDIVFVERLGREAGVKPCFLADEKVLHLWHPRNWAGTSEDL